MVHSQDFYSLYQKTYEKYAELYGSQVCVFLQKGSFYELYGIYDPQQDKHQNTVKEVADMLDLQLKVYPNDVQGTKTGLFGGVPEHTIHKWAGKLCNQGWTCVLIDQQKDVAGNVTARKVSRVLSPGTHLEQVASDESMYVSCVYLQASSTIHPPTIGIAAIECTTGDVFHYEEQATGHASSWHADPVAQFMSTYQPKECSLFWNGPGLLCPDESALRILFDIPVTVPLHIKVVANDSLEDSIAQQEYLTNAFNPESLLSILPWAALDETPVATCAVVRLLAYLENHDPALIQRLACPTKWNPTNRLQVLNHAMEQLNIRQQNGVSVETLLNRCYTSLGKRKFKELLQSPWSTPSEIRKRHEAVAWVRTRGKQERRDLETSLRAMADLSRLHRQISRGILTHASAQQVMQTLDAVHLCLHQVRDSPLWSSDVYDSTVNALSILRTCLKEQVVNAYQADETSSTTNWLQPSKSPKTTAVCEKLETLHTKAKKWKQGLETHCSTTLTFRSGEATRFLLTIPKSMYKNIQTKKTDILNECSFKQMSSGVKVEHPTLDTLSDQTLAAEAAFEKAIQEESALVCAEYTTKTYQQWRCLEQWIADTDCAVSHAAVADQYRLVQPTIVDDETSHVQVENLRHILIERQATTVKYTTHSVSLGHDTKGILLYGINASGKSSLMKAIGISVVLAQCGFFVPATSMTLSPFRTLATRILNHDNIAQGMSSFTVEMSELREILRVADAKCLVLGDEVCAGTENVSGTAIVASSLQYLLQKNTRFVFATHLHDLMKLPAVVNAPGLRTFHLKVEYDPATDCLLYNRELLPGPGTTYYGLEVAKALHLPASVLESAYAIRKQLLGETTAEDCTGSSWNSHKLKKACEVCGCELVAALEVHHIQERASASTPTSNQDGTGLHDLRNLVTVCESCHTKHHSGQLTIQPAIQTTKGAKRRFQETPPDKAQEKEQADVHREAVLEMARENPGCALSLLALKLKVKKQIVLSPQAIKKLLAN